MSTTIISALRAACIGVLVLAVTLLMASQVAAQDPGYEMCGIVCQIGTGTNATLADADAVEPPPGMVEAAPAVLPSDPTLAPPTDFEPNAIIGDQIGADVYYIGTPDPTSGMVEQITTEAVYVAVDSDSDSLSDGDEITVYGTDPYNRDSDYDGLTDAQEITIYGTSANVSDSDNDGLDDWSELNDYFTNPLSADTDGDGWTDGYEVSIGSNPNEWHLH